MLSKHAPVFAEKEQKGPAALIESMSSYLTLDGAMKILWEEGYSSIDIIRVEKSATGTNRPRYDYTVIGISDYRSMDQKGTLEIYFFNDQLEGVRYYPDNVALYLENRSKEFKSVEPYIEVKAAIPYYVWIVDKRIEEKRRSALTGR